MDWVQERSAKAMVVPEPRRALVRASGQLLIDCQDGIAVKAASTEAPRIAT
jgi:hypothetical protein